MENLEQIEQEKTLPPQPSPKRKYLLIGVVAAITIVILFVGVSLLRNLDSEDIVYQQQLTQRTSQEICTVATDCVLVQDEYCGGTFAVNQAFEDEWKKDNAQQAKISEEEHQTCKPTTPESSNIDNFITSCEQSRCIARFVDPINTSDWQTYRN